MPLDSADTPSAYTPDEIDLMEDMLKDVLAREKLIRDKWLKDTDDNFEIYEGGKSSDTPFNILYSNTEILVPNLFSTTPQPIVKKRFGEMRADMASRAAERMAEYCMDTNISGYPDFVDAIEAAVLAAALPGQGQCRIRVVNQIPLVDYVQHDQYIWGYAKRWEDTPWVAYRHDKTKKDIVREFQVPDELASQIKSEQESSAREDKNPATIPVYEIWNKADQTVYFLCESFPDKCIQRTPDPLHISGFFPSGKPLRLVSTPASTMPKALYGLYRRQAEELNVVTQRIKRVTQAIQVRGIYDGNLPELSNLFETGDAENKLTPSSNPGGMARDGGLDRHIWMVPIDKLVAVLQQLFQVREQIKSTIYEIMGIGDILRGVSSASETASAQEIKDKWGSLRIKKSREKVSTFVRWYIRAMIELAAEHTPEEVWAQVTGLELMPSAQAQILAMQPQQPNQPPPPENWGTVLGTLRNDLTRSYLIDIESNSTVEASASEDKEDVTDFMNALGQSMPAVEGLATQGPEGHSAAKILLVEICKRFRLGNELQSAIMAMQPTPQGPTPDQQKMQSDLEQKQKSVDQAGQQLDTQKTALQQQFEQQKQQLSQISDQLKSQQEQLDKTEMAIKQEAANFEIQVKEAQLELQAREQQVQSAASGLEQQHSKALLDIQGREQALSGKQALDAVQSAQTPEPPADPAPSSADTAINGALTALTEQGSAIKQLLETLSNPPKMVIRKTGNNTFERSAG